MAYQLQEQAIIITTRFLDSVHDCTVTAVEKTSELAPDVIAVTPRGERVYLYVKGIDGDAETSPFTPDWEKVRQEYAEREGFFPFFLDVILSVQGQGIGLEFRGQQKLEKALKAIKRGMTLNEWLQTPDSQLEDETPEVRAERWMQKMLKVVAGKPIDEIDDDGAFCYTYYTAEDKAEELAECERVYGRDSAEYFGVWFETARRIWCPYWEFTDHGTVKCKFLEQESTRMNDSAETMALSYFGSQESLAYHCQGPLQLGDAIKCCHFVVERVKANAAK